MILSEERNKIQVRNIINTSAVSFQLANILQFDKNGRNIYKKIHSPVHAYIIY